MTTPIFRAQTIGSMLRSEAWKNARRAYRRGELAASGFKRVEDAAVDEAIAAQEHAGIDIVTDGEQRRTSFLGSLLEATEGLSRSDDVTKPWHEPAGGVSQLSLGLIVTGKLRRVRSLVCEEFTYARSRTRKPIKVALPSPMMLSMFWSAQAARDVYNDPFDLFADGAAVIRAEIAELARLGCEHIQIDAPELATLTDPTATVAIYERNGIPPARLLTDGLDILNSLADAPGVTFGLHLCRGNNDGRWLAEGGYEVISAQVFRRATRYASFMLEYDDARSGSFAPLADIPRDKIVVLGLVSTKQPAIETPHELHARIADAAHYFPHGQLALSPQCGFASGIYGNPITHGIQEAKLKLVAEVAHREWA
jgi:5-methyltetrahydropteroyltriglutamate--homocysteine methyltransferase